MHVRRMCLITFCLSLAFTGTVQAATVTINSDACTLYSNPSAPEKCSVVRELLQSDVSGNSIKTDKKVITDIVGDTSLKKVASTVMESIWYASDYSLDADKMQSKIRVIETPYNYTFDFADGAIDVLKNSEEGYVNLYAKVKDLCDNVLCIKSGDDVAQSLTKAYDYLSKNYVYDYDARYVTLNTVFDTKRTQCWQITKIFDMICDYLGVNCECVSSGDSSHLLNIVHIDNEKYYVDCTAGIGGWGHRYFLTKEYDLFGGVQV